MTKHSENIFNELNGMANNEKTKIHIFCRITRNEIVRNTIGIENQETLKCSPQCIATS